MRTLMKSSVGFSYLMFLASLASLPGAATAATDAEVGGASGVQLVTDNSSNTPVQTLDTSLQIGSGFWANTGDEIDANWLEIPSRYIDPKGLYLEGIDQGEGESWPVRTDSPFELNDAQSPPDQDAVKYVTVAGVKPELNANFNLDRSSREGWAINSTMVGTLPEPGTLLLMGLGLIGLGLARRRAARKAEE